MIAPLESTVAKYMLKHFMIHLVFTPGFIHTGDN